MNLLSSSPALRSSAKYVVIDSNTVALIAQPAVGDYRAVAAYSENQYVFSNDITISDWKKHDSFTTNLQSEDFEEPKGATWEEITAPDFDVVVKINFNKKIKIKGKIKSISRYIPKIVID